MRKNRFWPLVPLLAVVFIWGGVQALGAQSKVGRPAPQSYIQMRLEKVTNAQRRAAAAKIAALQKAKKSPLSAALGALLAGKNPLTAATGAAKVLSAATLTPNATPDYYNTPNYANSPLPDVDASGNPVPGTGIRKFVDSLPGLGAAGANNLGQFIPVAVPDQTTYPGADYYVIGLIQYTEKLHSDLPPTTLRGYVQLTNAGVQIGTPNYLGPTIIAQKNRPVRVKFINRLPVGTGGNLFLPVDTTVMGAGMGPQGGSYSENRATLHLHGGLTPWISDGTPHQWTTPAGEVTTYTEGVSVHNVPDMDGGHEPTGTLTFYYTNQQSARLMFYHDHTYGLTRLNVYAGEAAPYILQDPIEQTLVNGGTIPANAYRGSVTVSAGTIPTTQIPLVIQDKSFVPTDTQLAVSDPTWDKAKWGGLGSLWLPHVYMPNQISGNDAQGNELGGVSAMGRWDYNPWFYPPIVPIPGGGSFGTPVPNPLYGQVGQPAQNPGTPLPTIVPEAFMDTPLVNGTAYPFVQVGRKAYRFRILNACNDRTLNLQIYFSKSNISSVDASGNLLQTDSGEVPMTVAAPHPGDPTWPSRWPTDGRDGGVPDPSTAASGAPEFIQIGNEGGFLPSATVLPNTPVGYEYFRRTITALNVTNKTLFLGPAERADVIVDFSQVPDGSKLILYNDAPAPVPAFDSRLDYYTGDPDQRSSGGAPTTFAGYGPNTRTIMQFQVSGAAAPAFNITKLQTGLQAAYAATQDKPIVPEKAYESAFATTFPNTYAHTADETMTFKPVSQSTSVTIGFDNKAIIEGFDQDYGRMNANLGGTLPNTGPAAGAATPYDYTDPPTDVTTNTIPGTQIGSLRDGTQIWRLDHQGVDTHAIHFHLFNVQVINRIALDGQLFYPDGNELGWKETVRMNPGQDVIIALRPIAPTLPWKLPDSIRPLNPALPVGSTFVDQLGTVVTNSITNFGWEYVWHCHLLGHEENDMMRPLVFEAAPAAPTTLAGVASAGPLKVTLKWTNNDTFPVTTNLVVQRATNSAFTTGLTSFTVAGRPSTYVDTAVVVSRLYYYRVRAESSVGFSPWTNTISATTPASTKTASTTTIRTSATSILYGRTITLSGSVVPNAAGQIVTIQRRIGTGTWANLTTATLGTTSAYTRVISQMARGTWSFRTVYAGTATVATSTSGIVTVVVR